MTWETRSNSSAVRRSSCKVHVRCSCATARAPSDWRAEGVGPHDADQIRPRAGNDAQRRGDHRGQACTQGPPQTGTTFRKRSTVVPMVIGTSTSTSMVAKSDSSGGRSHVEVGAAFAGLVECCGQAFVVQLRTTFDKLKTGLFQPCIYRIICAACAPAE